ncbi:GNAT family N-acetyltransferase [Litorivivens sp.]|uniref:GNAT family N-acetyltransferase n=1 Tax=Litorivivens sp. TaxID=2020868 RepID=UPI00356629C5
MTGNAKRYYRDWSATEPTLPIFSKGWWLDAVAPDGWSVTIVENDGSVAACMPYIKFRKGPYTVLGMPPLTQNLGPWISHSSAKYPKRLAREKDLMGKLIDHLPDYHGFYQNWHYSRSNWLPFYWRDFSQTTRYTYVIEGLSKLDAVFSEFEHSKRKNIKKAEESVIVSWDLGPDEFYHNHKMTLRKQGQTIAYSYDVFRRVYDSSHQRGMGRILAAYDSSRNLHAALFIVFDEMSAYDLISTIDPDFRASGAASLLVKEAIKYTAERGLNKFDFEGSMIESVERSFRNFGARQVPYHAVSHVPSRTFRVVKAFGQFLK